jgi:nucleoside-diphosphate-sugar epimerase
VRRILVTGASGFIGRCVAPMLGAAGYGVRVAVRRASPATTPAFEPGIELMQHGDLAAGVDWRPLLAGMEYVVHLAGVAHSEAVAPAQYDRVNRDATAELAQAARAAAIRRLVFVSSVRAQSGAVAERILTEADAPQPTDPYGRSKLAAEAAVRQSGVPFTVLRPVVVYGAGVKGNLRRLITAAALPLPLPLGAFTQRRSLLGVHNLTAAMAHVLRHEPTCGETYLVADPQPVSLADIVAALRRGLGRSPGLVTVPPAMIRAALAVIGRGALFDALAGQLIVDPAKLIASGCLLDTDTASALTALVRRDRR